MFLLFACFEPLLMFHNLQFPTCPPWYSHCWLTQPLLNPLICLLVYLPVPPCSLPDLCSLAWASQTFYLLPSYLPAHPASCLLTCLCLPAYLPTCFSACLFALLHTHFTVLLTFYLPVYLPTFLCSFTYLSSPFGLVRAIGLTRLPIICLCFTMVQSLPLLEVKCLLLFK